MGATATCSAHATLAEGADPRGVAGSRFCAQKTTSGGLCVPPPQPTADPFPDPSCPVLAPSILDGAGLLPGRPRGCSVLFGPLRACRLIFPSRLCFLLVWEQDCAVEPAGCPTTCIPTGVRPRRQRRTQRLHCCCGGGGRTGTLVGESPRLSPWLLCRAPTGEASIAGGSSSPSRVICWEPGALGPLPFPGRAGWHPAPAALELPGAAG